MLNPFVDKGCETVLSTCTKSFLMMTLALGFFCRINIYHASDYYIKKEVFCVVYGLKRRVLGNCHLLVVPLDVLLYFVYGLHMYASCKYVLVHITALWCVSSALLVFRA